MYAVRVCMYAVMQTSEQDKFICQSLRLCAGKVTQHVSHLLPNCCATGEDYRDIVGYWELCMWVCGLCVGYVQYC